MIDWRGERDGNSWEVAGQASFRRSRRPSVSMQAARILLAIAVAGAIHLSAPGSADASAVCPPPGTRRHHTVDATNPGPLTEQFRPVYGALRRGAAAWPGQEIVLTGFVSSPEGLGGTSEFTIEPEWLVSRAHWLSTSAAVDPESGPVGPFLPVAVPGLGFASLAGHWVRVSGRFDDPVAKTCVVTEENPDFAPTPEQAIQICQTSFVLTSVAPLAAPNTDGPASPAPAQPPAGPLALLAAMATGAAFVLSLRRPRRGADRSRT